MRPAALRVEHLQAVDLSLVPENLIGAWSPGAPTAPHRRGSRRRFGQDDAGHGSAALKAFAVLIASWFLHRVHDEQRLDRIQGRAPLISRISTSSIARRPAVSTSSTSK